MRKPRITTSDTGSTGDAVVVVPVWQTDDGVAVASSTNLSDVAARVSDWVAATKFKGSVAETTLLPNAAPGSTIAVVGLGKKQEVTPARLRRAAGAVAKKLFRFPAAISYLHEAVPGEAGVRAAAEGFVLGSYRFSTYKSAADDPKLETVGFPGARDDEIAKGRALADAVTLARDLVNEPPSVLTPAVLAERAHEVAATHGLDYEAIEGDELTSRGFGGIAAVGQGSTNPPTLIRLRYAGGSGEHKVALVGKGITFDSGGLSLKDAKNMETMKTDMAGAAAVIAAIGAAAQMKLPLDVTAYVPAAENMPSGAAVKPGDVITHYGGNTTEVLNTDAEGRLVLGDALALAAEQGARTVVDVATLTGSIMVALGKEIAGVFSNDDGLRDELIRASEQAGEIMWPMPLHRNYRKELESEIADQKNVGTRYGGSITAALFLNEFIPDGVRWAHLDIAGIARSDTDSEDLSKGGTGLPTPTLVRWLEAQSG